MSPRRARPGRTRIAAVAAAAIALGGTLAGCGKRGDPEPPESAVPEAIDDLVAASVDGTVRLTWSAPQQNLDGSSPPELVGFQVLHSFRPFGITDATPTPAELRFVLPIPLDDEGEPMIGQAFTIVDREPRVGALNTYRVVSYSDVALESPSSNLAVVPWEVPPNAPSAPRAIPEGTYVVLEWSAPATRADGTPIEGELGYRVYRSAADEDLALVTPEPVARTSWTDRKAPADVPLTYVVRAVLPAGDGVVEGASSEAAKIIAQDLSPPPVPRNLIGTRTGRGVELRWNPVDAPDLGGYHVYRGAPGQGFERLTTSPTLRAGYRDDRPPSGAARYRVTAVDRAIPPNESAASQTVRVD